MLGRPPWRESAQMRMLVEFLGADSSALTRSSEVGNYPIQNLSLSKQLNSL